MITVNEKNKDKEEYFLNSQSKNEHIITFSLSINVYTQV